ncbi:MAG: putative toxin-antitoxin system toxin component, PIN family [Bacteroidota bacterium]
MNVVLDTNVLVVAISSKSIYRPIFDAFIEEKFQLCVTTDILMEYEEILGQFFGKILAQTILQLIETAPNVHFLTRYYKWSLIKGDADDNKFSDCAIAGGAEYLVSNDKHFNALKKLEFPKINLVKAGEFLEHLQKEEG